MDAIKDLKLQNERLAKKAK